MNKNILRTVLADNQTEVSRYAVTPRDFRFDESSNYVLVGIRRAGKSFLLYQRMQEFLAQGKGWDEMLYVNFEDERLSGMKALDLNMLIEIHLERYGKRPVMFLDEIQNIEGWEKFARRLADMKYTVYITGSNAKMLGSEVQSTLGGRYIPVCVYPYGFTEFLNARGLHVTADMLYGTETRASVKREFNDYFHGGGFPEGIHMPVKRDYLTSLYQKIYLGDIAARHSVENTFALRVLFRKMAESVKQPVSFNRLSNIVSSTGAKVGTSTVINYVEYAKEAWLVSPVPNYAGKLTDKESSPKYYFTDNGILNLFLLGDETSLLENLVAVALLRKYGREDSVFFYNRNIEVDFYIPESGIAIQVCYSLASEDTIKREVGALEKFARVVEACRTMLVITMDEEKTIESGNRRIEVIPVWKWLMENNL